MKAFLVAALAILLQCGVSVPALCQSAAAEAVPKAPAPAVEPAALAILKATSDRLADARTMQFTATSAYESFARTGQPLTYMTVSHVALRRPDKLRVITPGDGLPTEFYYNGKTMTAFSPATDLVAVAHAPATIDAMVKQAYDQAAIYFPFVDVIVADPYKGMTEGLQSAFVVGQSHAVGGTLTNVVAVASDTIQAEVWIGAKDKLPRMIRALFPKQAGTPRYNVTFSDWRLNSALPNSDFASSKADRGKHIQFARPDNQGTAR